jgi:hypothetical protein
VQCTRWLRRNTQFSPDPQLRLPSHRGARAVFSERVDSALRALAESEDGRAGVVAAVGCGALVEAWGFAQEDETRIHIANALVKLGWREEGSASAVSKRRRCV